MRRAPSVLATVRNSEAATSILAMNWLRRAISTFGEANTSSPNVNPRVDFSGFGRAFLWGDFCFTEITPRNIISWPVFGGLYECA